MLRYFTKILIFVIKLYQQAISPYLASRCRFHPSCSSYAIEAIEKHGCFRGCYLATYRILRCQPFSKGGHDPVPRIESEISSVSKVSDRS